MKQMDTNGGSIDRSICTPRVWSCLIQPGAGRACFGPNCEAKAAVTCGRAVSATGIWEVLTSIQNPFEIHWNLIESFKIHSKSISKSIDMLNLWRAHRKSSRILLDKCSELFWWDMKRYEKAGGLRQTHFRLWLSLLFDWRKSGRGIESSGCRAESAEAPIVLPISLMLDKAKRHMDSMDSTRVISLLPIPIKWRIHGEHSCHSMP